MLKDGYFFKFHVFSPWIAYRKAVELQRAALCTAKERYPLSGGVTSTDSITGLQQEGTKDTLIVFSTV
jgi:hypothetical protein